jgi:SAM-dependent methyltransferase
VDRPPWAPDEVDIAAPGVARVYDYYLGGSHNVESDRTFGQRVLDTYPVLPAVLRENRGFLRHVATGVDQFLDLGSGIPTVGNVHEMARAATPGARVVYVDHDPVAITHSRELLAGDPRTYMLAADFLDPDRVLAEAVARGGLDLDRPVAVLALSCCTSCRTPDVPPTSWPGTSGGSPRAATWPSATVGRTASPTRSRDSAATRGSGR